MVKVTVDELKAQGGLEELVRKRIVLIRYDTNGPWTYDVRNVKRDIIFLRDSGAPEKRAAVFIDFETGKFTFGEHIRDNRYQKKEEVDIYK